MVRCLSVFCRHGQKSAKINLVCRAGVKTWKMVWAVDYLVFSMHCPDFLSQAKAWESENKESEIAPLCTPVSALCSPVGSKGYHNPSHIVESRDVQDSDLKTNVRTIAIVEEMRKQKLSLDEMIKAVDVPIVWKRVPLTLEDTSVVVAEDDKGSDD